MLFQTCIEESKNLYRAAPLGMVVSARSCPGVELLVLSGVGCLGYPST